MSRAAARTGRKGGAARFLKENAFEFVLLVLCSTCLSMEVGDGFNVAYETLFNLPFVIGSSAVLLAVCYLGAFVWQHQPRRTWIVALACIAVMGVVVWASVSIFQEGTSEYYSYAQRARVPDGTDAKTSYGFVLAIVPVLTFLLSRRRGLCVVLFALGIFVCGLVQWLFKEWLWVPFIGFLLGSGTLFILRTYRLQRGKASGLTVGSGRRAPGFHASVTAVLVPVVLVAASFGIWYGVIAPQNPQAAQLKLVQVTYQPQVDILTNYRKKAPSQIDRTQFSSEVDDRYTLYTSNPGGEGTVKTPEDDKSKNKIKMAGGGGVSYAFQNLSDNLNNITYGAPNWLPYLLVALLIALIVGAIMLRRYLRKRWYTSLDEHTQGYRVCALYDRITRNFQRMRLSKPAPATQSEWAQSTVGTMAAFEQDAHGTSYRELSDIYERVYYGHSDPSEGDVAAFESFWKVFYKNARKYSGPVRYIWRFWRI